MSDPIVYLNGQFMPLSEAKISVLDRGFIFGDGIYEVIPAYAKKPFRLAEHLRRLRSNLDATRIKDPNSEQQWNEVINQLVAQQDAEDQSIYLQITRGVAKRDHAFPAGIEPTVFMMSNPLMVMDQKTFENGVGAITLDDIRWQYCNIKAIALLPNILLRQTALDQGAQEAILVRNDIVTEGSASNIFMVTGGVIKTAPNSSLLLPGITRDLIVELAHAHKLPLNEVNFTQDELLHADEVWLTSSTKEVLPIVRLNEKTVGNGKPGPVARRMFEIFQAYKAELKRG